MPSPLTKLLNLGRSYSMWVYQWGLACCAIEMIRSIPTTVYMENGEVKGKKIGNLSDAQIKELAQV